MGKDKVEKQLQKLSLLIELRDFSGASKLLSEISEGIPAFSQEEAAKLFQFLDIYSRRLRELELEFNSTIVKKDRIKKSYLK